MYNMDLVVWIAIVIVFLFFAIWIFMAEDVKLGENFVVYVIPGTAGTADSIAGIEILDLTGNKIFTRGEPRTTGSIRKELFISGGAHAFAVNKDETGKIVGIGPFMNADKEELNVVLGRRSDRYNLYSDPKKIE
jgi:hypothetical protein